jgi:uncharacterized membrane protein
MKILRLFHWAYVFFALLFFIDAFNKWGQDRNSAYISLFFSALAIFMFVFRSKFRKRFEKRAEKN